MKRYIVGMVVGVAVAVLIIWALSLFVYVPWYIGGIIGGLTCGVAGLITRQEIAYSESVARRRAETDRIRGR